LENIQLEPCPSAFLQTVADRSPTQTYIIRLYRRCQSVTLLPLRRQSPGGSSTCRGHVICLSDLHFYPPLHRYVSSRRTRKILIKTHSVQSRRMPNVCFVGDGRFVCDSTLSGGRNKIIPRSHSYCLSLPLCLEWYNGPIAPRVHSGACRHGVAAARCHVKLSTKVTLVQV